MQNAEDNTKSCWERRPLKRCSTPIPQNLLLPKDTTLQNRIRRKKKKFLDEGLFRQNANGADPVTGTVVFSRINGDWIEAIPYRKIFPQMDNDPIRGIPAFLPFSMTSTSPKIYRIESFRLGSILHLEPSNDNPFTTHVDMVFILSNLQ